MNEVEATAKKAARGAGYPWGLAEEAGRATRWLCLQGMDGCGALAGLLTRVDGVDLQDWWPLVGSGHLISLGGTLCPLAAGTAVSDHAATIRGNAVTFGPIVAPIMVAPFAAMLAFEFETSVTLTFDDHWFTTDGVRLAVSGRVPLQCKSARLSYGGAIDDPTVHCQRADPAPGQWATLLAFAHRTYAPATEESRRKGAGGGLSDND